MRIWSAAAVGASFLEQAVVRVMAASSRLKQKSWRDRRRVIGTSVPEKLHYHTNFTASFNKKTKKRGGLPPRSNHNMKAV